MSSKAATTKFVRKPAAPLECKLKVCLVKALSLTKLHKNLHLNLRIGNFEF